MLNYISERIPLRLLHVDTRKWSKKRASNKLGKVRCKRYEKRVVYVAACAVTEDKLTGSVCASTRDVKYITKPLSRSAPGDLSTEIFQ